MKRILLACALCLPALHGAFGQSNPGWVTRQVPTAAQWNAQFSGKMDWNSGALSGVSMALTGALTANTGANIGTASSSSGIYSSIFAASGQERKIRMYSGSTLAFDAGMNTSNNYVVGWYPGGVFTANPITVDGSNATITFRGSTGNTVARISGSTTPLFETNVNTASRTVLGRTSVQPGTITFSGAFSTGNAPFGILMSAAGTPTGGAGADFAYNNVSISSDTAACGASLNCVGFNVTHNFGTASMTGSRAAGTFRAVQTAQSGASGLGDSPFYVGLVTSASMAATEGGTNANLTGSKGNNFGLSTYALLGASATNVRGNTGFEINPRAVTGATYAMETGMQIVHLSTHAVSGTVGSAGYRLTDQPGASARWRAGLQFSGEEGQWAIDATEGELVNATLVGNFSTVPFAALNGINIQPVTFSGHAILTRGMAIGADGTTRIGTGYITPVSTGITIDAAGSVGRAEAATISGGAIVSAGTSGFVVNDVLYDAYSGIYVVDTVNGSGQITQLSVYRRSYATGSPSATVTLTRARTSNGVGTVQVTQVWTASSTIRVGATTNNVTVGGGSDLATNATTGFLQIPTVNGTPTGVVGANGAAALVLNRATNRLCVSVGGGTWVNVDGGGAC